MCHTSIKRLYQGKDLPWIGELLSLVWYGSEAIGSSPSSSILAAHKSPVRDKKRKHTEDDEMAEGKVVWVVQQISLFTLMSWS